MRDFTGISRRHDGYVRERAQNGEVLGGEVRHAKRAVGQSPTDGHDLHVGVVIADVISHLLQATQGGKVADAVGEHDVPGQSKPGGDTRQVLLRDTDIVELTRMLRAELVEHGEPQVPGQQHDPRVLVRSLHQAVNERGSHAERSSSASARSYSSPFGVR